MDTALRVWWDTAGLGIVPDQREAFIAYAKFVLEMELREDVECFEAGPDGFDLWSHDLDGVVIVGKKLFCYTVRCYGNVHADMEKVCKELLRQWVDASGEMLGQVVEMYGIYTRLRAYFDSK